MLHESVFAVGGCLHLCRGRCGLLFLSGGRMWGSPCRKALRLLDGICAFY